MFEKILSFLNNLEKKEFNLKLIVDPIILSSSGKNLIDKDALEFLKSLFFQKQAS